MQTKTKAIIAVEDKDIYKDINNNLIKQNLDLVRATSLKYALQALNMDPPALIITDTSFSDGEGIDFVKEVTRISRIPIIVVSREISPVVKTLYLEIGADDYINYPFDNFEFLARLKAVTRRCNSNNYFDTQISFNGLNINMSRYELKVMGNKVDIPPKELELLYFLASKPNVVFDREQLLDKIWGYDYFGDSRTVDVHIKRIRQKIKGYEHLWTIETVWRVGYKFVAK